MSYNIEKCDVSQLDALVEFYNAVIDHLDATVNYPLWTKGVYPAEGSIRGYIHRDAQYACIKDGRIVGAFALTEGDYPEVGWSVPLRGDQYLVIHSFATLPEVSGRGIGRGVVQWCIDRAKKLGYRGMRIDVVPSNSPAAKLYEKLGFRWVARADLDVEGVPLFDLYELNF